MLSLGGALMGQSIWTGASFNGNFSDPQNWYGSALPGSGGSAVLLFTHSMDDRLTLPASFTVAQIRWESTDDDMVFNGPATLNLGSAGITGGGSNAFSRLRISSNVTLNLGGATTFDLGTNSSQALVISGQITGTGPLTLANGNFLLNRTSGGNSYTGGTVIGTATAGTTTNSPTVTVWNNSPFGSGPVSFLNGAFLYGYAPNAPSAGTVLTNAITLNASGSATLGSVTLRAADTKFELSGPVTLAGNALLQANMMQSNFRGDEGYLPLPGAFQRNPIVLSGNIGETGGARSITFRGPGLFYLTGTNSWTGGTVIGQPNGGSVVFSGTASIPTTGTITVNGQGYAGVTNPADIAVLPVATGSQGAIGFDTALGASSPTLVNSSFSLAGFTDPNIRIGTATQAILGSGATLTPQGSNYRFGNGGGTLYVQSSLSGSRGLVLSNGNTNSPLRLFVQGTNSFTGGTNADSGQLIFDSVIPGTGQTLVASNTGYIGITENAGLTPAQFIARFQNGSTTGTVGFDTAPTGTDRTTAAASPRTISDPIDFSTINGGFGSSTYLGTATSVILSGTLTPNAADSTHRFTAARGGRLTVASNLGSNPVVIGIPTFADQATNGTVALLGTNSQSSTTLTGGYITLEASAASLGTGALNLAPGAGTTTPVGLRAANPSEFFTNPVNFQESLSPSVVTAGTLALLGGNAFTLGGNISGPVPSTANNRSGGRILIYDSVAPDITLSGDNSAYYGGIQVGNGTLTLASANAASQARVALTSADATLNITQSTTLRSIQTESGSHIGLATGTTLTIDVTDTDNNRNFDLNGTLGGIGRTSTNAALVVTGTIGQPTEGLFIRNASDFTGGTTITGAGAVAIGHANALGTGGVTINAAEGGLALAPGVTYGGNLTFTSGALAGRGTFSTNLTSYDFSGSRGVIPGLPGIADFAGGKLTLTGDAVFGDNGFFVWGLQDASLTEASGQLDVTGMLSLTATAGLFKISLESFNETGDEGLALNFNSGNPYTWTLATAAGGITGFDPARFTLDTSSFANPLAGGSFSLSQSGNSLLLSFTPVPEPSTYALLALGLGLAGLVARRRS
jgi:autotransporter-associated beta strand protein